MQRRDQKRWRATGFIGTDDLNVYVSYIIITKPIFVYTLTPSLFLFLMFPLSHTHSAEEGQWAIRALLWGLVHLGLQQLHDVLERAGVNPSECRAPVGPVMNWCFPTAHQCWGACISHGHPKVCGCEP